MAADRERVAIVAVPSPELRRAVDAMLARYGFTVAIDVSNLAEAVLTAQVRSAALVVVDLTLTGERGLAGLRHLRERLPGVRVIVFAPAWAPSVAADVGSDLTLVEGDLAGFRRYLGASVAAPGPARGNDSSKAPSA